jgi:hypothetical protein
MLLAARMKRCDCGGMKAFVFLLHFLTNLDWNVFIKCEVYICFACIFNLQNKERLLSVM